MTLAINKLSNTTAKHAQKLDDLFKFLNEMVDNDEKEKEQ
jgi:hypothetical protein